MTDNRKIARVLREIADLLDIKGENSFRIRSYRMGADTIEAHGQDVAQMLERGEDLKAIDVPVLILHGENDAVVPVAEAYSLQRLLDEKGVPYEIKIYPGTGHGFENEVWGDAGLRTLQFLQKHLCPPQE